MRTLRERCEAAEAEAASTRGQLANARRQLATLQEEASASGKQRSLFSAEAAALRARVEAGDAAVKRLNDELEAATLRVQGLEADLEEAQTERNRFATVNGQLEDVRLEMRKATQKATAAQAVRVLAAWLCSCSCAVSFPADTCLTLLLPLPPWPWCRNWWSFEAHCKPVSSRLCDWRPRCAKLIKSATQRRWRHGVQRAR